MVPPFSFVPAAQISTGSLNCRLAGKRLDPGHYQKNFHARKYRFRIKPVTARRPSVSRLKISPRV
jgi:hypothetical protein